ncbi:PadR family transcriptional regulator [Sporosarcina sp. FSL K6-3457]|uniref:PadR family transcriptional regulator n=1 Tax=Sporosarcina sp. FSL K6-3457 TaxID=2978204 RepID=UPI0030FA7D1A
MSLRYGILGLLSKWDASGYDIKKEFDDFMSIFWHSHLSQIYPELSKLEKDQLVDSKLVPQDGKPDKKVFSITEKGADELAHWLHSQPETPKIKDAFLMQAFFMDNIPADEVIFQLKFYQKERQQRLEKMQRTIAETWQGIKERNVMSSRIVMSAVVLKRGIEQEIDYIKWCEETIQFVESCKYLWDNESSVDGDNNRMLFDEWEEQFMRYFGGHL